MALPDKIRINREEDYYTHFIGSHADGQFMGFVVATLPQPMPDDWEKHKRWYAILHLFDRSGSHLQTKSWFSGVTNDGEPDVTERAQTKLQEYLSELEGIECSDVEIKLFQTKIDGETFGLVPEVEPEEEYEAIHLVPNDLAFFEPWNGEYDT